jgi:hypothetical protein
MRNAGKKNKNIILLTDYCNTVHHIEPSGTIMIESSGEKQSNLNVTTEPSDEAAADTTDTLIENAGSELDAIASGNVLADTPQPTFLDEGPNLDVPLFITRTNARELFGLRPGETVAQALARKAKEG